MGRQRRPEQGTGLWGKISLYGALAPDVKKLAVDLALSGGWQAARREAGGSMELTHHSAQLHRAPKAWGPGWAPQFAPTKDGPVGRRQPQCTHSYEWHLFHRI